MMATFFNHFEIVKYLINEDKGININEKDYLGYTSLIKATQNKNIELKKFLIEKGANINDKNESGNTALIYACASNFIEGVKILIENGADINYCNPSQKNCLMFACVHNNYELINYLLHLGADFTKKDIYQHTSLMVACSYGNLDIVKLLISKGANYNDKDITGYNSLFIATIKEQIDVIIYLMTFNDIETVINDVCFTQFLSPKLRHHFILDYKGEIELVCPWCRSGTFCDTNKEPVETECLICYETDKCFIFDCFNKHLCCVNCLISL